MSNISDTTTNLLATSSNKLGFDLWKTLRSTKGNLSISPASISSALTMTWAGARGVTAKEMGKVLNLDIAPRTAMAEYSKLTAGLLYDANFAGIDLSIVNRLFGDKSFEINDEFLSDLAEVIAVQGTPMPLGSGGVGTDKVDIGMDRLDFKNDPEGARTFINNWIEARTKNRIKGLLPSGSVDATTGLVLANALYFLANWKAQFNEKHTMSDMFMSDGGKYPCNMMYRSDRYRFSQDYEAKIIELPYVGDSLSMIVVLPHDVDGLEKIEMSASNDKLTGWRRSLREESVVVQLPRFTVDPASPIALSSSLRELGMEQAFINGVADFSGISKEVSSISEAYHKTFIKVTEKGTEMAAATAVAMSKGVSMGSHFRADHPFSCFIVDSTSDLVLGMGRVTEPKE